MICGDYSSDRGTGSVPAFLAHELGAAQALGLVAVDTATADTTGTTDGAMRVVRRLDGGRREVLAVAAPAVLSVEGSVRRLRRAGLAATVRSKTAAVELVASPIASGDHHQVAALVTPYRPRARTLTRADGLGAVPRARHPRCRWIGLDHRGDRRARPRRGRRPHRRAAAPLGIPVRLGDATWPDVGAATTHRAQHRRRAHPGVAHPDRVDRATRPAPPAGHRHADRRGDRRACRPHDRRADGRPDDRDLVVGRARRIPRHAVDRRDGDGQRRARAGPQRRLGRRCGVRQRPRRQPQCGHPGRHPPHVGGTQRARLVAEVAAAQRRWTPRPPRAAGSRPR